MTPEQRAKRLGTWHEGADAAEREHRHLVARVGKLDADVEATRWRCAVEGVNLVDVHGLTQQALVRLSGLSTAKVSRYVRVGREFRFSLAGTARFSSAAEFVDLPTADVPDDVRADLRARLLSGAEITKTDIRKLADEWRNLREEPYDEPVPEQPDDVVAQPTVDPLDVHFPEVEVVQTADTVLGLRRPGDLDRLLGSLVTVAEAVEERLLERAHLKTARSVGAQAERLGARIKDGATLALERGEHADEARS